MPTKVLRVAIPMEQSQVSSHFGRSDAVTIFEVDADRRTPMGRRILRLGSAACESIPLLLASAEVHVVLAGQIGAGARSSLASRRIDLIAGWTQTDPQGLLTAYLGGEQPGGNGACNHDDHEHHHRKHCRTKHGE